MDENGKYGGASGAHKHGPATPFDQFVKDELVRRKAWAEHPATRERQRYLFEGEQERARVKRAQRGDLIGPPNPYKPHRR